MSIAAKAGASRLARFATVHVMQRTRHILAIALLVLIATCAVGSSGYVAWFNGTFAHDGDPPPTARNPYEEVFGERRHWGATVDGQHAQQMLFARIAPVRDDAPVDAVGYYTPTKGDALEFRFHFSAYALTPLLIEREVEGKPDTQTHRFVIMDCDNNQQLRDIWSSGQWQSPKQYAPGLAVFERKVQP